MIDIFLLLARVVLCVVFVASALAKFRDQDGTRRAVIDFGVPESFSRPIAAILPAIELLFGIGLLPVATSRLAAAGVTVLLAIFTVAITVSILRGKRTVCHCFGESGNEPVSWWSVGRNLSLSALSVVIVWSRDAGAGESTALLIALVVCAGLAWALINLFRRYGRLLLRIEELEKGKLALPAPSAEGLSIGVPIPQFAFPAI